MQKAIYTRLGGETVLMKMFNSDTTKAVAEVAVREN